MRTIMQRHRRFALNEASRIAIVIHLQSAQRAYADAKRANMEVVDAQALAIAANTLLR